MDRLHIRDCFAQLRSIRRLMNQLIDDCGDLTLDRSDSKAAAEMGEIQDYLSDVEGTLHRHQSRLEKLSREAGR